MKRCQRNDRHDAHIFEYGAGGEVRQYNCPGYLGDSDALDKTPGQRRMEAAEEALANVRTLTNETVRLMLVPQWYRDKGVEMNVRFRAELVKANATAALAYAIGETGSDIEVALSRLASALESGISFSQE